MVLNRRCISIFHAGRFRNGGGFGLLKVQLIGVVSVMAWSAVCITVTFLAIKAALGLRVSEEEEILGLDITEHN